MCAFHGEGVGLRIKHPLVQWDHVIVRKQQVKIFQRFGEEEGLLDVVFRGLGLVDVPDSAISAVRPTPLLNSLQACEEDLVVCH